MNPSARKTILTVGIISSIAAIGYGIFLFYKRQVALAMQYCYKISDVKFLKLSATEVSIQVFIKIQNKSNFTVEIKGYDFVVSLNNRPIANVTSDKTEVLAANSISTLNFMVNSDPSKVFDKDFLKQILAYMITDKKKIIISVDGTIQARLDFINLKHLKFNYMTTVYDVMNTPAAENVKCDIV